MPSPTLRCCPNGVDGVPLTYIDLAGSFWNKYTNTYMTVSMYSCTAGGSCDPKLTFGKCGLTQMAPAVYGDVVNPIECPCCADGYVYNQWLTLDPKMVGTPCVDSIGNGHPTVPCISCVCTTPPPPPPCETCSSTYHHTSFVFNPFVKVCKDCIPQGEPRVTNDPKYNAFLPYFMLDPIINFTLDN